MSAADNRPRPRTEIAVAVVEQDGKFLIGKRETGLPLAGLWEFPGGKVEPHETPETAAVRECLEESGLVVRVAGTYPQADHDYEHASVRLHFFACTVVADTQPLPERFRWVRGAELGQFAFPPANSGLLAHLTAVKTA